MRKVSHGSSTGLSDANSQNEGCITIGQGKGLQSFLIFPLFPSLLFFFCFVSANNVRVQIASYETLIGSRRDIPSSCGSSSDPLETALRDCRAM